VLSENARALMGQSGNPMVLEVEKGAIKKFADAVNDRNPLYWDEKYASSSRFGSIIAPFGFFGWPTTWENVVPAFFELKQHIIDVLSQDGYKQLLDGGIEYEFFLPVKAGDTVTCVPQIVDIKERESKNGAMVIFVIETRYSNQHGELVAIDRKTNIQR
jgi:acyl dehydratase